MTQRANTAAVLASLVVIPLIGCSSPSSGEDSGEGDCDEEGKCDIPDSKVPASPCDGIIVDRSGAGHEKVAGRNKDFFSQLVMRTGTTCPTSFNGIMAKLREVDNKDNCKDDAGANTTRFISETAQALGKPDSYRLVTTRTCGSRPAHGIIFSLFGVEAGQKKLPEAVEIISFDPTAGVFNYYETTGNELGFFGSSKDMLDGPGDDGMTRRCAKCHTGGGLVMKELDTPWLHWEGHTSTPGVDALMAAHKVLGTKSDGAEFESTVKQANTEWNATRIKHLKRLKSVSLQDLLRPLFCSVEVNTDNGADFDSPVNGAKNDNSIERVTDESLLDPQLGLFESVPVTPADYEAVIKANKQTLPGITGAIDTLFDYVFIERSHADNDFIEQLKTAGIVDNEFVQDVLMIDFTRPVFSTDRCNLLSFAPNIPRAQVKAAVIRDALIKSLETAAPAAKTPAGKLLANLKTPNQAPPVGTPKGPHFTKVKKFLDACKALGSKPFLQNALAITSLNRSRARMLPVFEFPSTMPIDKQTLNADARLDPATCKLVNQFVP